MNRNLPLIALIVWALVVLIVFGLALMTEDANSRYKGERSKKEERHVARWDAAVDASGQRGYLLSIAACETGPPYNSWNFSNNGNGFWFRHQYTPSTWGSVGGRFGGGIPRGRFGHKVPSRHEQLFRALRVLRSQGPGAWPNCA